MFKASDSFTSSSANTPKELRDVARIIANLKTPVTLIDGNAILEIMSDSGLKAHRSTKDIDLNVHDCEQFKTELSYLFASEGIKVAMLVKRESNVTGQTECLLLEFDNGFNVTIGIGVEQFVSGRTKTLSSGITCFKVPYILADKIIVLSNPTIQRRIKDFIDIYYLSTTTCITLIEISEALDYRLSCHGNTLGDFYVFLYSLESLKRPFDKFKGLTRPIDFDTVYVGVSEFVIPVISLYKGDKTSGAYWDKECWRDSNGLVY